METGHMSYADGMEAVDSDIMGRVLSMLSEFDYNGFSGREVEQALHKERLTPFDFAAVLSPAAEPYLETLAHKALGNTRRYFGNSVSLFTPLYISNYCENECVYCGFNCSNKIHRGRLSMEEIAEELQTISATGLKEILILTGESRTASGTEYIGEAVKLAAGYFSTVGIEIYPLNSQEYAYLHECGADFVSVYQETYNTGKYEQVHLKGPKRVFPYRFNAQERALLGGMRGVGIGALLGLDDFRRDAYGAGLHAYFLQQKYPHAEIAFSVPRLRPYINSRTGNPNHVHERQLLQVMLAYRLFMPFAGITISTREKPKFRDNIIGLAATKISAGVSVGVGGHKQPGKGDGQFEISDSRSVAQVHEMIERRGLQPVYNDYIRV
ncbi:2-iminoacetate synthase [Ruminiclostridium hungatei]|uniref:2-iminoacetate synthase n=1 Tax=Ruminiclostridium hungatei TaxID=48256 RepID=A0A1V4SKS0_RUMHU|nr:2-iminoacetate synthase ThiH [Ruminiclostridium hungatei]OPX44489.1 2-iminoacetate synthase [Ruminiclostridium hungatei]